LSEKKYKHIRVTTNNNSTKHEQNDQLSVSAVNFLAEE